MGRLPRIQFEGACYHVANRGRGGQAVFGTGAAARVFVQCLHEVCVEAGWRLHAYTLLKNDFHLALTTPQGNLAEGMHWLQSTYAVRLNRHGQAEGHLFGGRYRATLVEPGVALARWVAEIHLGPVRAGIIDYGQLAAFRWSSFRYFLHRERPSFLDATWLAACGGLNDTADGWRHYREQLARRLVVDPAGAEMLEWPRGGRRRTRRLRVVPAGGPTGVQATALGYHGRELAELREPRWIGTLESLMAQAGHTQAEVATAPKGAAWKVALAAAMRRETTATNAWLARMLGMGTANAVSVYLGRWRREQAAVAGATATR